MTISEIKQLRMHILHIVRGLARPHPVTGMFFNIITFIIFTSHNVIFFFFLHKTPYKVDIIDIT